MFESVEKQPAKTAQGYLVIGRYYPNTGAKEKAKDALMMAKVMERATYGKKAKASDYKSLAKKIGDEGLAKAEPEVDLYERAGFVDLAGIAEGAEFEVGVGEAVKFYSICRADESKSIEEGEIRTTVMRIVRATGAEYKKEIITKNKHGTSSKSTSALGLPGSTLCSQFNGAG